MTQMIAATISQAGTFQGNLEDCFLNGSFIPDSFAQMTAEHKHLEHSMVASMKQTACFAIFDSQGSTESGDVAPRLAAEDLKKEISRIALLPLHDLDALMNRYASHTREHIRHVAHQDPSLIGMGTGLICICAHEWQAVVFQSGHGRAYLLHQGELRALVTAQSTPDLTAQPENTSLPCVSSGLIKLEDQDRILLCSESLANSVSVEAIRSNLEIADPHHAAAQLVGAAMHLNGRENVTVTVIVVSGMPQPHPVHAEPGVRFDRTSAPQPHLEHQPRVLPLPEKEKVKTDKTKFTHVFFWEVIPAWLQFWSLIILLILLILMIWLIGPRLFGWF